MGKPEENFHSMLRSVALGESLAPQARASARFVQQRIIEETITAFRPDFNEAMEILDALQKAIETRFGEERTTDVVSTYKEYREAINEADCK